MALIQCPECSREISDRVTACPHCGYPFKNDTVQESTVPQQVEVTSVKIQPSIVTKKFILIGSICLVALFVLFFAVKTYNEKQAEGNYQIAFNSYIDNLQMAQLIMLSGGSEAESLCNLTAKVWRNAIYKTSDSETDKYTKPGYSFVNDFNEALSNLYSDPVTVRKVSDIKSNQETVKGLIRDLQSPPDGLERCYDTVTELYASYKGLTDLAINPSGNYNSFSESKSKKVSDFMEAFEKLSAQIPDKLKVQ